MSSFAIPLSANPQTSRIKPPHYLSPIDEHPMTGQNTSLATHVEFAVREYFNHLKDQEPTQLYDLMLHQFEKPLISVVLEYTRGNQTRTAEILGLNRGTLRKKLKTYHLM